MLSQSQIQYIKPASILCDAVGSISYALDFVLRGQEVLRVPGGSHLLGQYIDWSRVLPAGAKMNYEGHGSGERGVNDCRMFLLEIERV